MTFPLPVKVAYCLFCLCVHLFPGGEEGALFFILLSLFPDSGSVVTLQVQESKHQIYIQIYLHSHLEYRQIHYLCERQDHIRFS